MLVALFTVPTCLLHRLKVGGDVNAFSQTTHFLHIAALLLLLQVAFESTDARED